MINCITRNIRTYFTGKESIYRFQNADRINQAILKSVNLYIHIPFCNNLCPYCPYFKVKYDSQEVPAYLEAILTEIKTYRKYFGKIEVSSIYIGGGTPTLLIDELKIILESIKRKFSSTGDICLEVNPKDVRPEIISKLKAMGVSLVSVGVQSFINMHLNFIGRKYKPQAVDNSLNQLVSHGFKSVNVDLLFALPKQNIDDIKYDLDKAIDSGVNQITTYPLFTFPYTAIGKYLKLKKVKMPNLLKRHKQYYFIHRYLSEKGFNRVSVWGFKKGSIPRYSSVTRDKYIGLGAGAGSHLPDGFYLNTFSLEEYIKKCALNQFPLALYMKFTENMQRYFWLYWRFYDTFISKEEFYSRFGDDDVRLKRLFSLLSWLNMIKENAAYYELTIKGAFWVHLLQNFFSLRYIDKIWAAAMKEACPCEVAL